MVANSQLRLTQGQSVSSVHKPTAGRGNPDTDATLTLELAANNPFQSLYNKSTSLTVIIHCSHTINHHSSLCLSK